MDVSFSAWRHSREESLQLKGDSFSFLFDRRYTNRLNRMSRVFFEAYVAATKELAAQEDRFPSLSEIDAKMESGAVYAFKDRLMKNTEFFEEVKISGVSYLVPRALKYVDVTGTYTDLILNFEEGTVVLPTRRKTPLPVESPASLPEKNEQAAEAEQAHEDEPQEQPVAADHVQAPSPPPQETIAANIPRHEDEPFAEMEKPAPGEERSAPPADAAQREPEKTAPALRMKSATAIVSPPARAAEQAKRILGVQPKLLAALGFALLLAVVIALGFLANPPPANPPVLVEYSARLSNSSNDSFLALEIVNSGMMTNDMEMALPPDIDRSISARGGIVTISHGNFTMVRMNSSSDASVKIYLKGNWTSVPLGLSFATPTGYDTSLLVHEEDYLVTRKNDTLVLLLNLTGQEVKFEQSYTKRD